MKLKEAPTLEGKIYTEVYSDSRSDGKNHSVVMAVDAGTPILTGYTDEDGYVEKFSEFINGLEPLMDENSVILVSGFLGDTALNTEVNTVWKSVMSAIRTTDYAIGDVIVWKKNLARKNTRNNRLDTVCEPIFVLCRKEEYRSYHLNVNERTRKGNISYHTPVYNIIRTDGTTEKEDHDQMVEYLIRMYCPDDGTIYYPYPSERRTDVQDK